MEFLNQNLEKILAFLLILSEGLGTFSFFKSNSIFQLVFNIVKKLSSKGDSKTP